MDRRITMTVAMLAAFSLVSPVGAKTAPVSSEPETPAVEGVYDVPGHPGMKLRVFVYRAKPGPAPAPTLVCSLPDPGSATAVPDAGWKLPSAWTYVLNMSSVPATVGSSNLAAIVDRASQPWEDAVGPAVTVNIGGTTSVTRAVRDGQNIITWGRTSGSALAVSYIWYTGGVAQEVDTIFNSKFRWYWSDQTQSPLCAYSGVYDAQNILTHELGHTFGLDDVYDAGLYGDATMYGYGSTGEVKKDTLTSGDIDGVQALYQP